MQRELRRRSLMDTNPQQLSDQSAQQQIVQEEQQPQYCMLRQKPLCSTCGNDSGIMISLLENNQSENIPFCSRICISKYFFKYQLPKKY
jgi:hypothetical protein